MSSATKVGVIKRSRNSECNLRPCDLPNPNNGCFTHGVDLAREVTMRNPKILCVTLERLPERNVSCVTNESSDG
jgi:hypothetical protein